MRLVDEDFSFGRIIQSDSLIPILEEPYPTSKITPTSSSKNHSSGVFERSVERVLTATCYRYLRARPLQITCRMLSAIINNQVVSQAGRAGS